MRQTKITDFIDNEVKEKERETKATDSSSQSQQAFGTVTHQTNLDKFGDNSDKLKSRK